MSIETIGFPRQNFAKASVATFVGDGKVESVILRPEPEPVYNIEVEDAHVYRVGESGMLVHNQSLHQVQIWDRSSGDLNPDAVNTFGPIVARARGLNMFDEEHGFKGNIGVLRIKSDSLPEFPSIFRSGDGEHSEKKMLEYVRQNREQITDVISAFSERSTCGKRCEGFMVELYDLTCSQTRTLYYVAYYSGSDEANRDTLYSFFQAHDFFGFVPDHFDAD